MLDYQEMIAVTDRATSVKVNPDGSSYTYTNIESIRSELWHNWALNYLEIEQNIESMRRQGLLVDYSEGANN
jgi:hypothetical protein